MARMGYPVPKDMKEQIQNGWKVYSEYLSIRKREGRITQSL